jgi:isoleucyl-tRNA synthetase
MMGYDAPLVPGWDCHGLPIEWKIEEQYRAAGKDKDQVDKVTFRAECRAFAQKWADIQAESFKRLGVVADFKNPYMTTAHKAEATIVAEIFKFLNNGLLYRGVKPVMWSTVEKTALAEAEIEYHEHKSTAVWVKFPIVKAADPSLIGANIVIWTTTPWTLPGNRAVAFGAAIRYGVFKVTAMKPTTHPTSPLERGEDKGGGCGERLILALSLADSVKEKAGIESWVLEREFNGERFFGSRVNIEIEEKVVYCSHPLASSSDEYNFANGVPVLQGDFVTEDTGTGFVHIAPGHGQDDYNLIRDYNTSCECEFSEAYGEGTNYTVVKKSKLEKIIPIESAVDGEGKYTAKHPLFAGKKVFALELDKQPDNDANIAVIKALTAAGALLAKGSIRHEYPHSWRSKAPVIFRTTPQWFIAMDKSPSPCPSPLREREEARSASGEGTLRQMAMTAIEQTKWLPPQGKNRIGSMIAGRPDWCISRQRLWGVPIALFLNKKTGEVLPDKEVQQRIIDAFEQHTADAWWTIPAQQFLGDKYNADDFDQVFDTVDVWFDSASTHAFVLEQRDELKTPADLYLEGSDQHRGWFHTSLLESCGTRGRAPYNTVLTHGFVLDEKGKKMSKSVGNVIAPDKVWNQYGADILRLWAMTTDYAEDVKIGDTVLKSTADIYRRIRNTFRYLLGALDGFTKDEMLRPDEYASMPELERLVLHWLSELDGEIRGYIKNYEFGKMAHRLHHFCNNELSSFYFDIRKDRLYCDRPDMFERRATRTVMMHIFDCLVTWFAPMLSFTAEEAWSLRPAGVYDDAESVHLRVFPSVPEGWRDEKLAEKWKKIREHREIVFKNLEEKRQVKTIGSSLEADVSIYFHESYRDIYNDVNWAEVCITSVAKSVFKDWDELLERKMPEFGENVELKRTSWEFRNAEGTKCARCWKVLPEVGQDKTHPDLCHRCADAVDHYHDSQQKAA